MGGLKKWFDQKWVDIGSKKKGGGHKPCGRKSASGSKRKYPKCVPAAKAARMTDSQKRSAVARKRAAGNPGGKPTNVATFAKRKKAMGGGVMRKNYSVGGGADTGTVGEMKSKLGVLSNKVRRTSKRLDKRGEPDFLDMTIMKEI